MSRRRRTRVGQLARHPIIANARALYALTAASLVVPLVTLPYLARVLEPRAFGVVILGQSFGLWLATLTEYGFGLSAARDVARHRDDLPSVARIASGVLAAIAVLLGFALVLTGAAIAVVPAFRDEPGYALLAWLLGAGHGLSPRWYFQGVERLWVVARATVMAQVLAALLIFALVRDSGDGWIVLLAQGGLGLAAAGFLIARMSRDLPSIRPRLAAGTQALRSGAVLFVSNAASSLFGAANVVLFGLFASTAAVAQFGAAERIARASVRVISPIGDAVFPRMSALLASASAQRARRLALLTGAVELGLATAAAGVLAALAPQVIALLLGPGYEPAAAVLRVFALTLPLVALGNAVAHQWMLPSGLDREYTAIVLVAGVANVILAVILAPRHGAVGMAASVVVAELLVVVGSIWFSRGSWAEAGSVRSGDGASSLNATVANQSWIGRGDA